MILISVLYFYHYGKISKTINFTQQRFGVSHSFGGFSTHSAGFIAFGSVERSYIMAIVQGRGSFPLMVAGKQGKEEKDL